MASRDDIGRVLETFTMPIEHGKIREFADATMDENPIFRDPEAAKLAGYENVPLPLIGLQLKNFWTHDETDEVEQLDLDRQRVLHGEQRYRYEEPIVAGDVLEGVRRVTNIRQKDGQRGGTMTFVTIETRYTNQDEEWVATAEQTLIETSEAPNDD